MLFKNLSIYRFNSATPHAAQLEHALNSYPFSECGSQQPVSAGWTPPLGKHSEQLVHNMATCSMICLKNQERVLPPACVREQLNKRIAEIEIKENRKLRGKEKTELKDEVIMDMLPKAFPKSTLTYAYIDHRNGYLIIDTPTTSKAEDVITTLRHALGSLAVRPLIVNTAPYALFTQWIKQGHAIGKFGLGDACELQSAEEKGQRISAKQHDLSSESITCHLAEGKLATQLNLSYDNRMSFKITDGLTVKQLKFVGSFSDQLDDINADSVAAEFDAKFYLMGKELALFISDLIDAMGGEPE